MKIPSTLSIEKDTLIRTLVELRDKWHRSATLLHTIVVTSGVVAVTASAALAAFNSFMSPVLISSLGFVSALAIGVPGALNIANKANNFRWANRRISVALMRHHGDGDFDALVDVYEEAEKTTGTVTVDAFISNKGAK